MNILHSVCIITLIMVCVHLHATSEEPTPAHITFHQFTPATRANNTAFLFAHGLGANHTQGIKMYARLTESGEDRQLCVDEEDHWLFESPLILFDFPEALDQPLRFKRSYVTLGSPPDVERLQHVHHVSQEQFPGYRFVGTGVSRGASVWLTYVATERPKDVAALILESPFDMIGNVSTHLMRRFHLSWIPGAQRLSHLLAKSTFPQLNLYETKPLSVVANIPQNMPILLIHSKHDRVVPINSSRQLYLQLKQTGHPNVFLLELDNGLHGKLMRGKDASIYQAAVHAFLARYQLPACKELIARGKELLAAAQPTEQEVLEQINQDTTATISWFKRARSFNLMHHLRLLLSRLLALL